jgi:hypothetical protein
MRVVADASVAVKWIFHDAPGEIDSVLSWQRTVI